MDYVESVIQENKIYNYLICTAITTLLIYCIHFILHRRKMYMHARNIPGPAAIPFVGSFFLLQKSVKETMNKMFMHLNAFPVVMKMWIGTNIYIFILKAEYLENILHNPNVIEKDSNYEIIAEFIGHGLLTLPAKIWKLHRKMISPSFNQKMLDSFVEIFLKKTDIFVDKLKEVAGQKDIDLYLLTSRCTLDMICETALGVDMNVQSSDNNLGPLVEKTFKILFKRVLSMWYRIDIFWNLSRIKKDYELNIQAFNEIIQKIVDKQLKEYEITKKNQSLIAAEVDESRLKRKSILDCMLNDTSYSREEMISEVKIFMIAGTETTAATLCYVFTMLGIYPEVQEKVYEELIYVLGPDRPVESSDISQLKYTDRVIKETMRLYPVVTFFGRKVTSDMDLGKGVILPENSNLIFPIFHIHRNPHYWKDPLKFDPDRFLPDEVAKRNNLAYFPFSLGPRNCIGSRYAVTNMKTILATTLRRFKVFSEYKLAESIDLSGHIFLRMLNGPKIRFELR